MTDMSLNILLSAQDGASSVLNSVGSSISNLAGGGVMGAVGIAAAAAGAAIVGIGVASEQMSAQYQQSMNMVQALTGSSTQQMGAYDASLKTLAVDAGVAPTALSQGLYNVLSSGRAGADAMNALTLATEDAKIGMTDAATTTSALDNILNGFKVSAADTTAANGEMLSTVTLGNSSFAQYAQSIVKASTSATQFHISMETMNSAWATMTANGIQAAQASTDFDQSLTTMYAKVGTVSDSLKKNGIAFNEAKFNTLDYGDKVKMLNTALQEATAKHVTVTGVTIQAAAAIGKISQNIGMYSNDLATLSDKQAMAQKTASAWATTQSGFTQQMSQLQAAIQVAMINIGNTLLPMLGQIVGGAKQVVTGFTDWEGKTHTVENAAKALSSVVQTLVGWVSQIVGFFQKNQTAMDLLKGSLAAAAVVIAGALVSAFAAWATAAGAAAIATLAATWPILAVAAVIGLLVAGFLYLYNNVAPFRAFMQQLGTDFQQLWGVISTNFMPIMQQLGGFLASVFMPVWQQMVATWQTQVIPAWNGLMAAIQPIMPQLQAFGQFLGVIVGTAILVAIGLIGGLIGALGGLLTGVAIIIGGIATFFAGAIQYISGIIAFFVDLFTGKFDKLGGDLGTIWGGIVKMFQGAWQVIEGIFVGAINGLIGLINGFVAGVLGPLNSILSAAHQATLSVGQIPMLSVGAVSGQGAAAPGYTSALQKSAAPAAPAFTLPTMPSLAAMPGTTTATPVSIPASSLSPVTGAVNTASAKSAAAALKSQQAAQVAAMKVSDTLAKATAASGSSQVQALVTASQQATAQGNTALATYDAGKAATLANQQKAAATKAAAAATKASKAAAAAATKASKAAAAASAKAAKASASQKAAATKAAVSAQKQAATLAAHAAALTQAAANQKELITTIQQSTNQVIAQQCPGGVSAIPAALGVALPDYATGSGYAQSAPVMQQAPAPTAQTIHHHYNVTVNSDKDDPKDHGKKVADAIKDQLAKGLRGQSIAPRYTSGGTR